MRIEAPGKSTHIATETETFLAWHDEDYPDAWNIRKIRISGLWDHVLGNDWYYMFDERPELLTLFERLKTDFVSAGSPYVSVDLTVRYTTTNDISAWWYLHLIGADRGTIRDEAMLLSKRDDEFFLVKATIDEVSVKPIDLLERIAT